MHLLATSPVLASAMVCWSGQQLEVGGRRGNIQLLPTERLGSQGLLTVVQPAAVETVISSILPSCADALSGTVFPSEQLVFGGVSLVIITSWVESVLFFSLF